MGPLQTWQKGVTACVIVVACAVVGIATQMARRTVTVPVAGFVAFHQGIAESVRLLIERSLRQQNDETHALAELAGIAIPREPAAMTAFAGSILHRLENTQCSRGAAIMHADGRIVAHTDSLNGMPAPADGQLRTPREPVLRVSSNPADLHLTFITTNDIPGSDLVLVCHTMADGAIGTSMPGYSETLTSVRAYLVRRVGDTAIVVAAPTSVSGGRIWMRAPLRDTPPVFAKALDGNQWTGLSTDASGAKVRAYITPSITPGWNLLELQLQSELMGTAHNSAIIVASLGVVLAIALVGGWFAILRIQRFSYQGAVLRRQRAEAQLQALRMELNPHFLFNTLNSVVALLRKGDPTGADAMLIRLSELLGATLSKGAYAEIPLRDELALVRMYLSIEEVRFADRLSISWDVERGIEDAFVPTLVLQPIVENAIRHGLNAATGDAWIAIAARREGAMLILSVENSGPDTLEALPAKGSGVGLANVRARLSELYQSTGFAVTLTPRAGGGATAELRLPFRREATFRPGDEIIGSSEADPRRMFDSRGASGRR